MNEILQRYNIKAKKSLWQNFLVDEDKLSGIVWVSSIEGQNIIEVWPGYGALTKRLLDLKPSWLHLVELDDFMIDILNDRIDRGELLTKDIDFVINKIDVLKYEPNFQNYNLIANIPYYITSPIITRFLYELDFTPTQMVILMQKEVWERICEIWNKNKRKSSILSLIVEKKASASMVLDVPKDCFVPAPKVDSVVVKFEYHDKYSHIDDINFIWLVKAAFLSPRKKLKKNLIWSWYPKDLVENAFKVLKYEEWLRAEDIFIDDYIELFELLKWV